MTNKEVKPFMSDMLNHYCCGREALDALPEHSTMNTIILNHYDAYRLGTQGPDFFYYHHPMPWKGAKPLHRYGNLIHKKRVDAFFYYGFKYAFTNERDRDIILSYLAGFSCHHSLDVATHPYIFYKTGHCDSTTPGSRIYSYYHKYFEVLLDVAHYQYEYQKLGCFFPLEKLFTPSPRTLNALEQFFTFIMKYIYGETTPRDCIKDALADTAQLARLFSDPNNRKRHFLQPIERLIQEERLVTRVFYPLYTNEYLVLNVPEEPWQHPCTGETCTDSYPQLFKQAVSDTVHKINMMDNFLDNDNVTVSEVHEMYGNKCYDRAIPCGSDLEMTYFDIIFEKHPQL